jgi:hypothetical protein
LRPEPFSHCSLPITPPHPLSICKALDLLSRLKKRLQRNYTRLRPRNISILLDSLLALGVRDPDFVGDLLHVSLPLLPDFSPSELACAVHALPGLGVQPSREWMAAFYSAADGKWGDFNAWGLATVAWSLGALKKRPPAEWLAGFAEAADGRWREFTPQGLSNVAWALAAVRAKPDGAWMRRFVRAAAARLEETSPQGVSNVCW